MAQARYAMIFSILVLLLAAGCATPEPGAFKPVDLSLSVDLGKLEQNVDSFLIILDASGSMDEFYGDDKKVVIGARTMKNMLAAIPDIPLQGGLRTVGKGVNPLAQKTDLLIGVDKLDTKAFSRTLTGITWAAGRSPLSLAISTASDDLEAADGGIAVIVVSDGLESDGVAARAAEILKNTYGDRLCIYSVFVGDDPDGEKIMERLALKGACGYMESADKLEDPRAMACFVARVFLKQGPDEDQDGIPDVIDQCKGTPRGAMVNDIGCWELKGLSFETNKATIKPDHHPVLNCAAAVLKNNPLLKVQINGHTDNRGAADFNMKLSQQRANAVMDYMLKQGISPDRLSAKGWGESMPVAPNTTASDRAANRRISITPLTGE